MPKKTLQSILPSQQAIREIRGLRFLGEWIYEGNLWHLNRYSAAMACFVGLSIAFVPAPGQMVLAALLAIYLRCNLPLSVALVWITNPLTMPAMYFLAYKIGALVLNTPVQHLQFELSFEWLGTSLGAVWKPFLLGCLICGLFSGSLGFFLMSELWRWHVAHRWRERQQRRRRRPQ